MKAVYLDFHHGEFENLSDRSIRQFMKKVATAVKAAQINEIKNFVHSLNLDYARQRSIQDRVQNASQTAPTFFVEKIKKGSLEAVFIPAGVILGVLLREIIVATLDNQGERNDILMRLKKYVRKEWGPGLASTIRDELDGRELGSHIVVDRVEIEKKQSKIVLHIELMTPEVDDEEPRRSEETVAVIAREIDRELKLVREQRQGDQ